MLMIRPVDVTESVLSATNIVETPPDAYDAATTYAAGDVVYIAAEDTALTLMLFKSLQDGNTGNAPTAGGEWWEPDGETYAPWSGSGDASQYLRPASDVSKSAFVGGYAKMDEETPLDIDWAYSENLSDFSGDTAQIEVALSGPRGTPSAGTTTVRYRIARTHNGTPAPGTDVFVTCSLYYEGTTLVEADVQRTATATWTEYSFTPDMTGVVHWDHLRLKFDVVPDAGGSNYGAAISWAELEAPPPASDVYLAGNRVIDTDAHRVYESLVGVEQTVTMTIASPCVVTWAGHGLAENTPILFTTTGALPTGITAGVTYYVKSPTTDTFNLAATAGGAAINTSGSQSGTHTATANPNKNIDPALDELQEYWLDLGPTNKWAMFDQTAGTVTSHPSEIDMTLTMSGRIDGLALFALKAVESAQVIISTDGDGTIYDETISLRATDGIGDYYSYCFEPIEQKQKLQLTTLPKYLNPTVRVILTGNGTDPIECGTMATGPTKSLGTTLHDGADIGLADYSRKERDDFGNYSITERAFSDTGTFQTLLDNYEVDGVKSILAQYRATPAVYSATDLYNAALIYGFPKEWHVELTYAEQSILSIDFEGLT